MSISIYLIYKYKAPEMIFKKMTGFGGKMNNDESNDKKDAPYFSTQESKEYSLSMKTGLPVQTQKKGTDPEVDVMVRTFK